MVALTETLTTEFTNAKLVQIENYQEVISFKTRCCWNLPLRNLEFEVLRCENSKATKLLTIFVLNTTPEFTIKYKPPDTNKDIFIETMNLHLDNLPGTKTIHHVVCGDFIINLLNTSFKAS